MPELLHADLELSRRLEGAEAMCCRAFCDTAASLYPSKAIRTIACAGGVATFYGPGDPINAVKGVGLNGPVDQNEWNSLEEFFRASNSPVVIDLSPLADDAFVAMLFSRGYIVGSFETVTCRSIGKVASPEESEHGVCGRGISVRVVGSEQATDWSRVVDVGFADGGEPMKFAVDFGVVRAHLAHSVMLLASVDGEPAGGAGMSIQGTITHMAGAAVLPKFRGRGIQRLLTCERLRVREHGGELAKLDVRTGSVSHRNATRCGFQVAYTRPQLVKTW